MDLAFLEHQRPDRRFRPDHAVFRAEIEDLRPRALFRLAHHEGFVLDDPRDFAGGIVEVAEDAALGRAHADARRQQLVLDAVRAEVALLGGVGVRIDEELIVRARFHAGAAADAAVAVEIDDPVAALEERVGRADARARRLVALVAQNGKEEAAGVGERALLDGLDPAAVHANGNLVFGFAGDGAGVTSDAFPEVDGEPVIGHAITMTITHPVRGGSAVSAASRSSSGTSGNVPSTRTKIVFVEARSVCVTRACSSARIAASPRMRPPPRGTAHDLRERRPNPAPAPAPAAGG